MAEQMKTTKIASGVNDILEFIESEDATIMERIVMLRSAADILNQIIVAEAISATMVASFKNIYERKE